MIIYEKLYSSKRKLGVFRRLSAAFGTESQQGADGEEEDEDVQEEDVMMKRKLTESDIEMENRNSLLYRLSSMAASKYGEGIMEHLLLVDDVRTQVSCVLAMPYLCR